MRRKARFISLCASPPPSSLLPNLGETVPLCIGSHVHTAPPLHPLSSSGTHGDPRDPTLLCPAVSDFLVERPTGMSHVCDLFFPFQQKPGMVPPPPGEESQTVILPPGWQSYLSPQGRRYYVNTATNGESHLQVHPPPPWTHRHLSLWRGAPHFEGFFLQDLCAAAAIVRLAPWYSVASTGVCLQFWGCLQ